MANSAPSTESTPADTSSDSLVLFSRLSEGFLSLRADPVANIQAIVDLCGDLLHADCVMYNRLRDNTLYTDAVFNPLPGAKTSDDAAGHVCTTVINQGGDQLFILQDVANSNFASTNPGLIRNNIHTYIAQPVHIGTQTVGVLCALFVSRYDPADLERQVMTILAAALGVEEQRREAEKELFQSQAELENQVIDRTRNLELQKTALEHSENLLRVTMDSLEEYIHVIDRLYRIVSANTRFIESNLKNIASEKNIGENDTYPGRDQVIGHTLFAVQPWLSERIRQQYERIFSTGQPVFEVRELPSRDGSIATMEVQKIPLAQNGHVSHVVTVIRDVSKQRRTEHQLQERTRRQEWLMKIALYLSESLDENEVLTRIGEAARDLMDVTAGAIYLLDEDENILTPVFSFDHAYDDIVLATKVSVDSSLTGRTIRSRQAMIFNDTNGGYQIPGTPQEPEERVLAAPFVAGDRVLGALRLNRIGAIFTEDDLALGRSFASFAATALRNAHALRDLEKEVQQHKNTSDSLRISESNYRNLFDLTVDPIYIADTNGIILDINQAATQLLGYSREEIRGMHITRINFDNSEQLMRQHLQQLTQHGVLRTELLHRHKDGHPVPIELNARQVTFQGQAAIMGVARDLTERYNRDRERNAMVEMSLALRGAQNRDEMFPIIQEQLVASLQPTRILLALVNPADGTYLPYIHTGIELQNGQLCKNCTRLVQMVLENDAILVIQPGELDETLRCEMHISEDEAIGGIELRSRDSAVGALVLRRNFAFDDTDRRMLSTLAELIANALQRAAAHEETERQLARLAALHTIDRAISSNVDMKSTLRVIIEQIRDQMKIDAADILLFEAPSLTLDYAVDQGFLTQSLQQTALRIGRGFAVQVAVERRTIHIPDLRTDHRADAIAQWWQAEGFVAYLGVPLIAKGQVKGVLELYQRTPLNPDIEWFDFLETLTRQTAIAIDNINLFNELQRSNLDLTLAYDLTLEGWAKALELRDKETEGHSKNVTVLTLNLAQRMNISSEDMVHIRRGALLHDIGKMGIPDHILLKPGPLSDEEWAIMVQHPRYAFELLAPIPYLRDALHIPYSHHERWDGSGYPRKLKGEQIPLAARIFSIVDVYDALSSDRPYRPRWDAQRVVDYLRSQSGKQFDPLVVKHFFDLQGWL